MCVCVWVWVGVGWGSNELGVSHRLGAFNGPKGCRTVSPTLFILSQSVSQLQWVLRDSGGCQQKGTLAAGGGGSSRGGVPHAGLQWKLIFLGDDFRNHR